MVPEQGREGVLEFGCPQRRGGEFWKKDALGKSLIPEVFPGGVVVKNPPANAGDTGLSPGQGRSHMPRSN